MCVLFKTLTDVVSFFNLYTLVLHGGPEDTGFIMLT